jgi:hypothetical protein
LSHNIGTEPPKKKKLRCFFFFLKYGERKNLKKYKTKIGWATLTRAMKQSENSAIKT